MKIYLLALGCLLSTFAFAKEPEDSALNQLTAQLRLLDSIEKSLHYQTGTITLDNGIATLNIPKGFRYLNAKESKYILEDLWGNLKGQTPLGMIVPENTSAAIADYAFIVEYNDIGYVKDNDAQDINYDDLLKEMKKENAEANKERINAGLNSMSLVGWANKPYYDKEKNVLYWAKEFSVAGAEENTLNYDVRVLGRKGVLVLQAVAGMSQLDSVNKHIDQMLGMVQFTDGNKYKDFNSSTDNVAAWTIGGLVAGKVLAKVGFFAVILKFLKFIILGIAAIGGSVWKWITGRRKQEEEFVYEPVRAPEEIES